MTGYRNALPQLDGGLFLTDGGIETTLIYHDGFELPHFAAFDLLKSRAGETALRNYFRTYLEIARRFDSGLILESPTWRANADWGSRLGYTEQALADVNRKAIDLLADLRSEYMAAAPIVISGCVGPRGDGYAVDTAMTADESEDYHRPQIETFADTVADMACALTMTYAEEAIGIVRAARRSGLPVALSFTVETDGHLPVGQPLWEAIEQVDGSTGGYPAYYMINCAHPTHFEHVILEGGRWRERIRGIRAKASCKSHAELDESTELDIGDPDMLGKEYARLMELLPGLSVLGGCCGTDHRHIQQIAEAGLSRFLVAS